MSEQNLTPENTVNEAINLGELPVFIKEPPTWTRRDTVFAVITIISSIFFVSLSLFGGFALGFTISYFWLFLLTVVYLLKSKASFKPFPLFCGGVSLALSVVFTIFNDGLINFLLFLAIFLLYGVFTALTYKESIYGVLTNTLTTLIISPLMFIAEPFRSYGKYCKESDKKGPNKQIILGVALSLPLLAIIIPLLISSDAAFEGLMGSLFSGFGTLIAKIILGVLLSVFLFSFLFMLKKSLKSEPDRLREKTGNGFPVATSVTLLSIISVFYMIYLFSQLAYFTSGFAGFLPKGYSFTPANYARRGFFELCAVCSINLTVIALLTGFTRKNENGKLPTALKITASLICFFSLFFTATALSKMFLYIGIFGLTRLRLLTSLFMAMTAVFFIGVAIYLYAKKFPITKYLITVLSLFALTVGFFNVDKTVARYNVENYQNKNLKQMDTEHLSRLSDSAVPYIVELLDDENPDIRNEAADILYERAYDFYDITDEYDANPKLKKLEKKGFEKYNYSRVTAERLIDENLDKILSEKTYYDEYSDY